MMVGRIDIDGFTHFKPLSPSDYKRVVFAMLSVFVCSRVLVAHEELDKCYSSRIY